MANEDEISLSTEETLQLAREDADLRLQCFSQASCIGAPHATFEESLKNAQALYDWVVAIDATETFEETSENAQIRTN